MAINYILRCYQDFTTILLGLYQDLSKIVLGRQLGPSLGFCTAGKLSRIGSGANMAGQPLTRH